MRRFLLWGLAIASGAMAAVDPFLVSGKVQADLDGILSRLIPAEQFLVQVHATVTGRAEKRLIEGETIVVPPEPKFTPVEPLPGFVPETPDRESSPSNPIKQAYRIVEVPELKMVRVDVQFDEALSAPTMAKAKTLVKTYLEANYRDVAFLTFGQMPMLKPVKEDKTPSALPQPGEKPHSEVDIVWNYARWAALALLVCIAFFLVGTRGRSSASSFGPVAEPHQLPNPRKMREIFSPEAPKSLASGGETDGAKSERRRRILERFLSRSAAFRQYFGQLGTDAAAELYACLRGQAFDNLLEGLAIAQPRVDKEPTNADDILAHHDEEFGEFASAKDWQERQFFGFLHSLTDEQVATLVAGEPPLVSCVLLRMMKPRQSAAVLQMMSAEKRSEIMEKVPELPRLTFSDLVSMERDSRTAAQRLPNRFFGSAQDDVQFWGTVVSESIDQDTIVQELVRTRPEMAGQLKKYRFRLEEAASLPDNVLERVLSEVDNEELCLALASTSEDVKDVFMDVLTPRRREVLEDMFPSYRGARKERTTTARVNLTKRIREAMT